MTAPFDSLSRIRDLPRMGLVGLVQSYRYLLRPVLGNRCRFIPTCSEYALEALNRHGAARGSALAGARLLRCHPFCQGGFDPVPGAGQERSPRLFAFLAAKDRDNARSAPGSIDTPQAAQIAHRSASPLPPLSNQSRTKISP